MTTRGGWREGKIYPAKQRLRPTIWRQGETEVVLQGDYNRFGDGDDVVFLTVPHSGTVKRAVYVKKPRRPKPTIMKPSLRPI
ncbi:hypothetical protein HYS47_04995 [Candidatus Woesearchaeota archaeon]|nr:hypothetical protein [Candidatus Woesearchaeota archaeon]